MTQTNKKAVHSWYIRNKDKPEYKEYRRRIKSEYRKKIRDYVKSYKNGKVCTLCGFADYRALQFHHTDRDNKEYSISEAKTSSIKKLKKEIEKCILICANCHQIEHHPL